MPMLGLLYNTMGMLLNPFMKYTGKLYDCSVCFCYIHTLYVDF